MDPFIKGSIVSASIILSSHVFICVKNKSPINQNDITTLIFQAFQIVCGLFLIGGIFYKELWSYIQSLDLYLFIAGVTLVINATRSVFIIYSNNTNNLK